MFVTEITVNGKTQTIPQFLRGLHDSGLQSLATFLKEEQARREGLLRLKPPSR